MDGSGCEHPDALAVEAWPAVTAEGAPAGPPPRVVPLTIVMLVVGTRGDVQPFLAVGRRLALAGHRVRLATHSCFRAFVEEAGLEYYPLGGDPRVLIQFVVKHRGLIPRLSTMKTAAADVAQQRRQMRDITTSCWGACTQPDMGGAAPGRPFRADAIIANPPSVMGLHCAEALGVPLHIMFTMPWQPTGAFPTPWVRSIDQLDRLVKRQTARAGVASDGDGDGDASPLSASEDGGGESVLRRSSAPALAAAAPAAAAARTVHHTQSLPTTHANGRQYIAAAAPPAAPAPPPAPPPPPHQHPQTQLAAPPEAARARRRPGWMSSMRRSGWWRATVTALAWTGRASATGGRATLRAMSTLTPANASAAWQAAVRSSVSTLAAPLPSANMMTYYAVDQLVWMGCSREVVQLRRWQLNLPVAGDTVGPHATHQARVPTTYIWSPSLLPKPLDWGPEVAVVGFVGGDEAEVAAAAAYEPPPALAAWLDAGPPPVFIGFGSLVMPDAQRLSHLCVDAARQAGVRLLLQRGWGGLGEGLDAALLPDEVFLLSDPTPHDWLFPRCAAVVHHGGAGTTACSLRNARPTTICSFFGDQPLWGNACVEAGVGPRHIPIGNLTVKRLVKSIHKMMLPETRAAAERMAARLRAEDGAAGAVDAFHAHMRSLGMVAPRGDECVGEAERAALVAAGGKREWERLRANLAAAAAAAADGNKKVAAVAAGVAVGSVAGVMGL